MNYGLNISRERKEQSEEDWVFGSESKFCLALIPENERKNYFPPGEVQKGLEDFMDCATRGPLNILETKFTFLIQNNLLSVSNYNWLKTNGYITNRVVTFSDRFVAINSGTTRSGNSLKSPLEAIRKQGLVPKKMLPSHSNMMFDDYHNEDDVTEEIRDLGQEFTRRFTIRYEKVSEEDFGMLLTEDMLNIAGYAWPTPNKGIYPRVKYNSNHVFMAFANAFLIFDNYLDHNSSFIKHLARDYNFFDYGYRVYIESEHLPDNKTLWQRLSSFFSTPCLSSTVQ